MIALALEVGEMLGSEEGHWKQEAILSLELPLDENPVLCNSPPSHMVAKAHHETMLPLLSFSQSKSF
jgi:hypothetical protein